MNKMEDRLRDAYSAAVQTVRPDAIRDLPDLATSRAGARPAQRRARLLIPLAAAAAVTAIVAGLTVISPLSGTPGSHPRHSAPSLRPGAPAFYLEPPTSNVDFTAMATPTLDVMRTATGKVVGTIESPPGMYFASQAAALAGDRRFLVAASPESGSCTTQFEEVTLNDAGQPGPLTPLGATVPGLIGPGLAVTPDGRTAAFVAGVCSRAADGPNDQIEAVSLRTRHITAWTTSSGRAFGDVSLSADGLELAFGETSTGKDGTVTMTFRVMPTSAPPGPADVHSRVEGGSGDTYWAALSPDGRSLQACGAPPTTQQNFTMTCYTASLASGHVKVIARYTSDTPEAVASLDSSGRYLLIQELTENIIVQQTHEVLVSNFVIADLSTGRLTSVPSVYPAAYLAW